MEKYDYRAAVEKDIREYLENNNYGHISDDMLDELGDKLFAEDSVTGNASGSYTYSTWVAEENICHNLDLVKDAIKEFGGEFDDNAERLDVAVRCYLIWEMLPKIVEKWNEKHEG